MKTVKSFRTNKTPILLALFILLCLFKIGHSAKILIFIGISSHSHRVAIQPLATKLSEIGHEVTFLSPIKPEVKNPKIKEYCPKALQDLNDQFDKEWGGESVINRLNDRYYDAFFDNFGAVTWDICYNFHVATTSSPEFLDWVKNSSFDLMITEHPCKEVALGLAHKFGAKVIGFRAASPFLTEPDAFGYPTESSWLPEMSMGSRYKIIPDHFASEFNTIVWYLYYNWMYLPRVDSLMRDVFNDDSIPPVEKLIKDISLYLVNVHFSNEYARSLPPFIIPVGGMHVKESFKPLPKNIEDFIQKGSDGFIYISFGSIIRVSALPDETRKAFFDTIRSFTTVRFLLKWEGEFPKDLPENVLPMKWFPQQDVLAHSKCRGFVSQGGLMSFQQSVYHGVPVIIVPVFGDQPFNAEVAVHQGIGIHLELADLTFDTFSHALGQLVYNEAYSAKAKEVARKFRDRPMTPTDTAVWWTEYVLRHNDTSHLKPLGIHQQWWQRRLLDFWALVFAGILLICSLISFTLYRLFRIFTRKTKNTITTSNGKIKKS